MPRPRKAAAPAPAVAPERLDEPAEPTSPEPETVPVPTFSHRQKSPRPGPTPPPETVEAGPDSDSAAATPPTGSTASTKAKPLRIEKAQAEAYGKLASVIFRAVGGLLHQRFGDDEFDEWLPDENDDAAVPPPIGRIAARHAPMPGGDSVTDIGDAIEAAIGLAFYAIKNLQKRGQIRAMRRKQRQSQPPPPVDDVPAEQQNTTKPVVVGLVPPR